MRTVLEDRDRQLWVGSASGLDLQTADGRFRAMLHNRGGKAPSVLSLAQGPDGDLWVGTFGDGVYRLGHDGQLRHNYAAADGMPGGNIRAISVDPQGVVWPARRRAWCASTATACRSRTCPACPAA